MSAERAWSGGDDGAPWLLGCVVVTKTSTCLVNARVRDPARGRVRVHQLCGTLAALHALASGADAPESFLTLDGFAAALCESASGFIVAVLVDASPGAPDATRRASAAALARNVARAFGRAGGRPLLAVIEADRADADERLNEYTVADELARDAREAEAHDDADRARADDEPRTWDLFASFEEHHLRPLLLRARPPATRWLEPLAALPDATWAHLLFMRRDADVREGAEGAVGGVRCAATRTLSLRGANATHPLAPLGAAVCVSAAETNVFAAGNAQNSASALWSEVRRRAERLAAEADAEARAAAEAEAPRTLSSDPSKSPSSPSSARAETLTFRDFADARTERTGAGATGAAFRVAMRAVPRVPWSPSASHSEERERDGGPPSGFAVAVVFAASSARGGAWGPLEGAFPREKKAASSEGRGAGAGAGETNEKQRVAEVAAARETNDDAVAPLDDATPKKWTPPFDVATSVSAVPRAYASAFEEVRRRVAADHAPETKLARSPRREIAGVIRADREEADLLDGEANARPAGKNPPTREIRFDAEEGG
jgi:hypothetical protein